MKKTPPDVPSASSRERASGMRPPAVPFKPPLEDQAASKCRSFQIEDKEPQATSADHCGSKFVLLERNPVRIAWSALVLLMLLYTATIFLYRFTFVFFHIGPNGPEPLVDEEYEATWLIVDAVVDILFIIDLLACFFMSFRDKRGCEVDSMRLIARNYLMGLFWINLVACIPDSLSQAIVRAFVAEEDRNSTLRVARLIRIQRISRLGKLLRLPRLFKCLTLGAAHNSLWMSFQRMRGVRLVNFMFGFMWAVHLLACGWYLCAVLSNDVWQTWVARRQVTWDSDARSLLGARPAKQWLNSMYFVVTVFTTVGFGDICAGTELEIVYVFITMVVGGVVHSIVIGEVIRILTSTEKIHEFIQKQLDLVEAFSKHTQLSKGAQTAIEDEVHYRAKDWMTAVNKDRMKELILGGYLPCHLMASLPRELFGGRLLKSDLFARSWQVPPRAHCLLAVCLHPLEFDAGEIVYQRFDFSFNMFLVLRGTFAHVALPVPAEGADGACEARPLTASTHRHRMTPQPGRVTRALSKSKPLGCGQEGAGYGPLMFPYRLHSCNSYFGEMGLLQTRPCVSTVRCETAAARTLALNKTDFAEVREQCPHLAAVWRKAAQRREWTRQKQLRRCEGQRLNYRAIAALYIQKHWRKRQRGTSGPSAGNAKSALSAANVEEMSLLKDISESGQNREMARMQEGLEGLRRNVGMLRREMRSMGQALGGIKEKLGGQEASLST